MPATITGDMHSINKANFAILCWFGPRFEPRFTNLNDQWKELYCADDPALYEKYLIRPVGQIDLPVSESRRTRHSISRRRSRSRSPSSPSPRSICFVTRVRELEPVVRHVGTRLPDTCYKSDEAM